MKNTLFSIAAIALTMTACDTAPKYTIKGSIEGEQTGNAFLIRYANNAMDTLARSAVADGKFTLEGNIENLTDAYITLEGRRGGVLIFVENADYTVKLNPAKPTENKVEGTDIQALANQYLEIANTMRQGQADLYKEYSAVAQAKDTAKMQEIEEQYNKLGEEAQAKEDALNKANADSYVAAYMLASKMSGLSAEELEAQYSLLGEKAKATEPGKKIAEKIEKLAAVAIGKVAPDFTLTTPEGESLSMHSVKGKVKVIDFWASWCGPCRKENPNVVKMYKDLQPKGLEILSVSLDNDKDAWVQAIADDQLTWKHVSDLKGWQSEVAGLYAVSGIPHLIVLDENNVIVAKDLRGEELYAKVAEMLK